MRILIVRLSSIGDVVRVLPALVALREAHPKATIDWAVGAHSAEVVEGHPAVNDTVVWWPPRNRVASAWRWSGYLSRIRRRRYDVALDFHATDWRSGLIVAASRAPQRYGFPKWRCRECSHWFTNCKVSLPSRRMNRVDEFVRLCRPVAPHAMPRRTDIHVPVGTREHVESFITQSFCGDRPIIVVHPPVEARRKRWPPERYALLMDLMLSEGGFGVVVGWGPGQPSQIDHVVSLMKQTPVVAPEFQSLKAYAWLMKRAALYVGNDTGPMHIASLMGTPVVALFGGSSVFAHAPYWEPRRVLHHALMSRKAPTRRSPGPDGGLHLIEPRTVYEACVDVLEGLPDEALQKQTPSVDQPLC